MSWGRGLALTLLVGLPVAPASASPETSGPSIAFASQRAIEIVRPALYTIGVDGKGRRRITPKWRGIGSPEWSPTGRWIAFERNHARTYVVPARGGRPIPIGPRTGAVDATWAPDGTKIALLAFHDTKADLSVAKTWRWRPKRLVRNAVAAPPSWFPDGRRIAYITGGREIRVVDAVTRSRRILLRALVPVSGIAVSPDGIHIAYTYVSDANGIYDLYVADLASGRQRRIARGVAYPAWSHDGTHIAAHGGGDVQDVYVLTSDGRRRVRIARLGFHERKEAPVWSPDGSSVLVSKQEVYAIRPDGHGRKRITHERPRFELAYDEPATWSPDGRRIAFVSQKHEDPDSDLYEIGVRGGRLRILTANAVDETEPAWSPDGKTLAFTRRVHRRAYIGLLRAHGRAKLLGPGSSPAWSPDGRELAFERGGDIYLMARDGTSVRPVTADSNADSEPAWAPDGRRIAFVRNTTEDQDIWSVAATGVDLIRITEVHAGLDRCAVRLAFSPAWSPDGSEIAYSLLDGGNLSCGLRGTWESVEAVSADGSRRTRLVTDGGRSDPLSGDGAYEPVWSPDGREIAFTDELAGKSRIAVVPSGGGPFRFVTPRTYEAFGPQWHP
jgi:TolB protein